MKFIPNDFPTISLTTDAQTYLPGDGKLAESKDLEKVVEKVVVETVERNECYLVPKAKFGTFCEYQMVTDSGSSSLMTLSLIDMVT